MKKKKLINGIICISSDFLYSCPLKLDDDYKNVILSLFYNNYSMHFGNLMKAKSLRKLFPEIEDEISAGKLAADYGYVTMEFREDSSNIFLPEFFNNYQLVHTLNEIYERKNRVFSLYNQFDEQDNDLTHISSYEAYAFIKNYYREICSDAEKDFDGYSLDRKVKARKLMK